MKTKIGKLTNDQLKTLSRMAWEARKNSFVIGNTRVGAAAMSDDSTIFGGCNVEHRFRVHDIHAEISAITAMVTSGRTALVAILIAAERNRFTPCGSCLDWIFQFGGPSCLVAFQSKENGRIKFFRAHELMPHYPK